MGGHLKTTGPGLIYQGHYNYFQGMHISHLNLLQGNYSQGMHIAHLNLLQVNYSWGVYIAHLNLLQANYSWGMYVAGCVCSSSKFITD